MLGYKSTILGTFRGNIKMLSIYISSVGNLQLSAVEKLHASSQHLNSRRHWICCFLAIANSISLLHFTWITMRCCSRIG